VGVQYRCWGEPRVLLFIVALPLLTFSWGSPLWVSLGVTASDRLSQTAYSESVVPYFSKREGFLGYGDDSAGARIGSLIPQTLCCFSLSFSRQKETERGG